jgi:hypothetical protein
MNALHTWLSQQSPFLVGYFATALDIGAYVPQIWRLLSE